MTIWEVILIGIALSMDAFAVSVADGMAMQKVRILYALGVALTFGVFQTVMPMAGYALVVLCGKWGGKVYGVLRGADHWVALLLLGLLGGKMMATGIKDARKRRAGDGCARDAEDAREADSTRAGKALSPVVLFAQGVATSIDALAVGITIGSMGSSIARSAIIIGATTTAICLPAVYLGRKTQDALQEKATIAGGAVLIAIGVRICMTHLVGD